MTGVSFPWLQVAYVEDGHIYDGDSPPQQLKNVPAPATGIVGALEREADQLLDKYGMGEHGPAERLCDTCSTPLDGRADQKTCGTRCRLRLSRECKKVETELETLGYPDAKDRVENDPEFADMVRTTAMSRLRVSTVATAVREAVTLEGADAASLSDDFLWIGSSPQPEQIVTGDQPAWQRVSRYDNPHHLRWPVRITSQRQPVTTGNREPSKPRVAPGPFGPIQLSKTSWPDYPGHFSAEG